MKNLKSRFAQQRLLPIILIGFVMFSLCWSSPMYSKNTFIDSLPAKKIYTVVEQKPEYVGGDAALFKFLATHIKYPSEAVNKKTEGIVYVGFVVNSNGSLSTFTIKRGVGNGCDEEALRVIKMMPNWIAGREKGNPVRVAYTLPIKFKLE